MTGSGESWSLHTRNLRGGRKETYTCWINKGPAHILLSIIHPNIWKAARGVIRLQLWSPAHKKTDTTLCKVGWKSWMDKSMLWLRRREFLCRFRVPLAGASVHLIGRATTWIYADGDTHGWVRSWVMKSELLKSRNMSLRLWHCRELLRAIQFASWVARHTNKHTHTH